MITFFVLLGVGALIIYRFDKKIKEGYGYVERAAAPLRTKVWLVPPSYRNILQKYFPYYRQLDDAAKNKFVEKVCVFIYRKRFIPRNVDQVTIEAKVLIAATAVQLTFGLNDIYLDHFIRYWYIQTIIIPRSQSATIKVKSIRVLASS